jgi:hypothetical protein
MIDRNDIGLYISEAIAAASFLIWCALVIVLCGSLS